MIKHWVFTNKRTLAGFVFRAGSALAIGVAAGIIGANAASSDISGAWSGGGVFSTALGDRENAKCRVRYSPRTKSTFHVDANCATASVKINQTATVRSDGDNSYVGHFFNAEYNVSGSIHITVNGNTQHIRLNSDSGSATLRLSR